MVDINIQSGQGISQALAEYAKNLNGGKALKINAKQWQSVMTKISEINAERNKSDAIFQQNNNIFGNAKNNFVVQQGTVSFSDAEMNAILTEMGLNQDIIDSKFPIGMNIKGLSIEKEQKPETIATPELEPPKVKTEKLETPALPKVEAPKLNPLAETTSRPALGMLATPTTVPVPTLAIEPVAPTPIPVTPTEHETIVPQEKIGNQKEISFLDSAKNIEYQFEGNIKSLELDVKDLNWTKKGRKEWNENHQLVTKNLKNMIVKDAKGKTIANYHEGKFYIGVKEVDFEKFQKVTAKKGDKISMNYDPELKMIKKQTTTVTEDIQNNVRKILTENLDMKLTQQLPQMQFQQPAQYTKKTLTPEFFNRVDEIAKRINCDTDDLLALINSESGFNTTARNKWTGATGLIQIMPQTAISLGTSVEELSQMSRLEQLNYVEKYLVSARKSYFKKDQKLSAGDLYGLVFLPAKSGEDVLAVHGTKRYRQNKGLDYDGDGIISRADLHQHLNKKRVDVNFSQT